MCLAKTYHQTVFVFDPNNQFLNSPVVDNLEDLHEWLDRDQPHQTIIFRPEAGRIEEDFQGLVDAIWPLGNYALIVDEASALQRPQAIHPALERLMRQAPRDGATNADGQVIDVSVIQTTHRPADTNVLCRALATDTFLFGTQLERDLDVIEGQYGPEVRGILPTLKRFQCIHHFQTPEGQFEFSRWEDPEAWYVPIAGQPN